MSPVTEKPVLIVGATGMRLCGTTKTMQVEVTKAFVGLRPTYDRLL